MRRSLRVSTTFPLAYRFKRKAVENELADVFIFLLALCVELEIDPEGIIRARLQENEQRFPVKDKVQDERP